MGALQPGSRPHRKHESRRVRRGARANDDRDLDRLVPIGASLKADALVIFRRARGEGPAATQRSNSDAHVGAHATATLQLPLHGEPVRRVAPSRAMRRPIAVFNANDDVIEAIAVALEMAGFEAVGARVLEFQSGERDLDTFLQQYDPSVLVWDIAPPYQENLQFLREIHRKGALAHRAVIITSTDRERLMRDVG